MITTFVFGEFMQKRYLAYNEWTTFYIIKYYTSIMYHI